MLLILVISFIICWSPLQIFYLMLWVFEDIRQDTVTQTAHSQPLHSTMTSSMNSPLSSNSVTTSTSFSSSSTSSLMSFSPFYPASTMASTYSPLTTTTTTNDLSFNSTSGSSSWYSILYYTMYFSFHWLSCAHTIINPFVYCFFSNNFQVKIIIFRRPLYFRF